jgi:hypothetical protein
MFDYWKIQIVPEIERDHRYKAIGEKIESVVDNEVDDKLWHSGEDAYQFEIRTKTKGLKFGHQWVDCHYPNSIWDVI